MKAEIIPRVEVSQGTALPGHTGVADCQCEFCRTQIPFTLPDDVINACIQGRLVVFAGAGISTESRFAASSTLYEEIARELGIDAKAFPTVMSEYERRHGRPALLQRIRAHFDYIESFPELHGESREFHRELSAIYPISEIITTNWDLGFEEDCGATPIVHDRDYAFWDVPGRKVFKLHGSISNWSSVVATEADYKRCYEELRDGVIGSSLRHLLATKTVLYVGHSLRDPDFLRLYDLVKDRMGNVMPEAFIVSLDSNPRDHPIENAAFIRTDGRLFIRTLRERLVADGVLLDNELFSAAYVALARISKEHHEQLSRIDLQEHPEALYALAYQDGLQHALQRALTKRPTGQYNHRCYIQDSINDFVQLQKLQRQKKEYVDVAYLEGYVNGLTFLLCAEEQRRDLPRYYVLGVNQDLRTFEEYLEAAVDAKSHHKTAYRHAQRTVAGFDRSIIFHHFPLVLKP